MPLHHAVLALLDAGPSYGYELKTNFEHAVGPQWGGLNIGHLYQVLDRLSRDGLVNSRREFQAARPDRVVYSLTSDGRAELGRWMSEPTPRSRGYRDDFFLKLLAAARTTDDKTVHGVLDRQRRYLLGELHNLDQLRSSVGDEPVTRLLITAAQLHAEADLKLVEATEEDLSDGTLLANQRPRKGSRQRPAAGGIAHAPTREATSK